MLFPRAIAAGHSLCLATMLLTWVSCAVSAAAPAASSPAPVAKALARSEVKYTGRFDFSDPAGPAFAWSGSSMAARFEGDTIAARLAPVDPGRTNNWVAVAIDGAPPTALQVSEDKTYVLASGLAAGPHEVTVLKRTEAGEGTMQFLGFELPKGGSFLAPPAASERRIEFIGDSITCGYGDEAKGIADGYQPSQESFYLSHAAVASRALGADCVAVAWSGRGVLQNYGGDLQSERVPELYTRTLPESSDNSWDFGSWTPDVVVINLGTNDYSVAVDKAAFTAAYRGLIATVRSHYPNAHIICAILDDKPAAVTRALVKAVNADGDQKVYFMQYAPQNQARDGIGGDWHPSAKTHAIMAAKLVGLIKSKLGW